MPGRGSLPWKGALVPTAGRGSMSPPVFQRNEMKSSRRDRKGPRTHGEMPRRPGKRFQSASQQSWERKAKPKEREDIYLGCFLKTKNAH